MCNWSCLLLLFIYSSAAVFVIVAGQPTTDDDGGGDDERLDQLMNTLARLEAKVTQLEAELSTKSSGGATYIRWGRKTCEDNGATLLYPGHAAGRHKNQGGGGSNYLCLPEVPQWRNHTHTTPPSGFLYGAEYNVYHAHTTFFSRVNNADGSSFHDKPAPCAVCYVAQRSASVMIPASTRCPGGWTQEYGGYLMSEHSHDDHINNMRPRHTTTYICVDEAPEVASGGVSGIQSFFILVKVRCGTLPCSKYIDGWELACVVCTK